LLISEGFIEPHFFAGFSGGRKSVLPGIAARETVLANHCAEFIAHPKARTGSIEGNPIHEDMLFAARKARLAFIINVVIDQQKRIVKAFAGEPEKTHAAGCAFLKELAEISVPESDIVITSNGGFPLDQNLYQSVKGMTAGEAAVRKGGVIIICAACSDGHGGVSFWRTLADAPSPGAVLEKIAAVPRNRTAPDQWEAQILARILTRATVILVAPELDPELPRSMHLLHAVSLEEAVETARKICGREKAVISVIPDGVSVIVTHK
jgi:nickel-dependent lactate racemase